MAQSVDVSDDSLKVTIECSKPGMTHVIGKGGSVIKDIQASTRAKLDTSVNDDDSSKATIVITAESADAVAAARERVEAILKEQENPDYEGPEGRRLREQADKHAAERERLKKLADEQFQAGDKDAGHKTMAQAKEEGEKMRQVSNEAARVIVKHRNDGKGDGYLDLHGLRVAEAELFTNERLDALVAKEDGTDLELIPGAGHHSAPGKVALKPAIAKLLTERGLEFEDASAGSFLVHVKGTSGNFAAPAAAAGGEEAQASDETGKNDNESAEKTDGGADEKKKEEPKKSGGCCIVM